MLEDENYWKKKDKKHQEISRKRTREKFEIVSKCKHKQRLKIQNLEFKTQTLKEDHKLS